MTMEQVRRTLFPAFIGELDNIDQNQETGSMGDPYLDGLLEAYKGGISRRQVVISFTKWMHGFNVEDVTRDLVYLMKEVNEAMEAHLLATPQDTAEELADVAIYCYGISQMLGIDLEKTIEAKMAYNRERDYQS